MSKIALDETEKKIARKLKKFGLLKKGCRLVLALSGGSDSAFLFHILVRLRERYCFKLIAAHVNYSLRGKDSDADNELVSELCRKHKTALAQRKVKEGYFKGKNVQSSARDIRYDFFKQTKERYSADAVLLAHNHGDQVETVLHRLIKGCGVEALAAMSEKRGFYLRPMLDIKKGEIMNYLQARQLPYAEDASNASMKYTRNKIRHKLIPALLDLSEAACDNIFRLSKNAESAKQIIRNSTAKELEKILICKDRDGFTLDLTALLKHKKIMRYEIYKALLFELNTEISSKRLREADKLFHSSRNLNMTWENGLHIKKEYGRLFIGNTTDGVSKDDDKPIELDKTDIGKTFETEHWELELSLKGAATERRSLAFDADKLSFPIRVRRRENGDSLKDALSGMTRKLKRLISDAKLTQKEREKVLVFEIGARPAAFLLPHRIFTDESVCVDNETDNILFVVLHEKSDEKNVAPT